MILHLSEDKYHIQMEIIGNEVDPDYLIHCIEKMQFQFKEYKREFNSGKKKLKVKHIW